MNLKLAYVHNIAMPGREANTVNVAKMCNALAAIGADVTLIGVPSGGRDCFAARIRDYYGLSEKFEAIALPPLAARPTLAAIAGAMHAQRIGAELVWTRAPHAAIAACAAGLPTLLEVHTDESAFSQLGRQALQSAVRHRNLIGVATISAALARHLEARHPGLAGRIAAAHDGADDSEAAPAPPKPRGAPLSIGYVGSLYRGRGIDLIEQIAQACPEDQFTIVGDGAERRASAASANVAYRKAVAHAEVPALLASFDVLIAPYQRTVMVADGRTDSARWMSPLKLFEYMAARRAIVASDLPVIGEVLTDGATALLCEPGDAAGWASTLTRLRDDPALRAALGERAYAQFKTRHTWRSRAQAILDALLPRKTLSARRCVVETRETSAEA